MDTAYGSILLLDGATGTELDRRGVNVTLPLWSALALTEAPDILSQVHTEYLQAGAEAITANTFRTHRRTLAKGGLGDRARELTFRAVEIAQQARDAHNQEALVLGSVAPLEDCYRPDLTPGAQECRDEHAEMIAHLLEAGVDMLLLETMNSMVEATAAIAQAREQAPGRWIVSFCTKTDGPPGVMLRGTPLADILAHLRDAFAVGVNCVVASAMEPQIKLLRALLPEDVRISAYANTAHFATEGQCVGGSFEDSDAVNPTLFAEDAEAWAQAGATIIGGCCGTTPETIKAIRERLEV